MATEIVWGSGEKRMGMEGKHCSPYKAVRAFKIVKYVHVSPHQKINKLLYKKEEFY